MAEKRYQVFVSSTFKDLQDERWEATKALMVHDCIVAGMEFFPSTGDDQFEYIKEIIDSSDYYLLILGGRYGTLAGDGVGYIEKEYDYALSKGMKPIALLYESPDSLPPEKRETDPELFFKFSVFRKKICQRLDNFWKTTEDLKYKVSYNIAQAIKRTPAIGWVRGNTVASEELFYAMHELRKENQELSDKIKKNEIKCFDFLNKKFEFIAMIMHKKSRKTSKHFYYLRYVFSLISCCLLDGMPEAGLFNHISYILSYIAGDDEDVSCNLCKIKDEDIYTVINNLIILGLIRQVYYMADNIGAFRTSKNPPHGFFLTDFGKAIALKLH